MTVWHFTVEKDEEGRRVDAYLAWKTGRSRSFVEKLAALGLVKAAGKPVKQSYRLKTGEDVEAWDEELSSVPSDLLGPEPLPLQVLYEDEHCIVVDKAAGMVMYPAAGHYCGTLMNALAWRVKELARAGGPLRPGVVHRIDKDTSGLVVVALTDCAYYHLVGQFKERTIQRRYLALVHGVPAGGAGRIDRPIGRSRSDRKKMSTASSSAKPASTTWRILENFARASLVEAVLATGRTHQIRVHFSSIGHPLLGDATYGRHTAMEIKGKGRVAIARQMLHAASLGFIHPQSGLPLEFTSPLPGDFATLLEALRQEKHFSF